jgi:aryl-alcohol dehydrogenase-like predicted oxidoreductase
VQPVEIALRRVLDAPGVGAVSFGSRNISHVEGSYAASRWRMSAEQWESRGDRRP